MKCKWQVERTSSEVSLASFFLTCHLYLPLGSGCTLLYSLDMRLLVVEDFQPLRESLVQGLREAGYAVDEAADGQTALWHASGGAHDVIVLDIMLPTIDGLSVLRKLRETNCPS